jgi:hypothetical protein
MEWKGCVVLVIGLPPKGGMAMTMGRIVLHAQEKINLKII